MQGQKGSATQNPSSNFTQREKPLRSGQVVLCPVRKLGKGGEDRSMLTHRPKGAEPEKRIREQRGEGVVRGHGYTSPPQLLTTETSCG